ncbi:MAG: RNA 2',3'-cyclic phosphodiesterase [Candidatus Rokuibacteriota bacterium]|nr:MAG: RNA 2',3'-cyclic phosphodiesterase [Candidatus Rokubacteria bacterium]
MRSTCLGRAPRCATGPRPSRFTCSGGCSPASPRRSDPRLPERLKSPRLRLFVAVDLPGTALEPLIEWRARELGDVPGARLVAAESLHVTLVFLGYQYERDVDRIASICFEENPPEASFELRPTELAAIPPRRPRLYALGLNDGGGAVAAWQGQLSAALHDARLYEPEKRSFWAHVTLARGKRDRALPRLDDPVELPPELRMSFAPPTATLYRSTLTRRGAVYDPVARIDL